ncbi:hypothetical protein LCI18_006992 [Fusarium solani-melongenae]|uniref:Uncharacterized protein n=1 Tax=Fusarium solani subsp. cucurbitae TaxID=2747967 RepID=A0ACD3Z4H6_FUSSC|nr:hypothetical protein LCI18_006992 [Fusarium solani-melongenae]
MDIPGMEGMTGSATATDIPGVSSNGFASTASATTLPALAASDTTHSDEVVDSPSAAQTGSMVSMPGMANTFHFGVGDTLWAKPLTPMTGQGYAGAIILLILMAVFLRFLTTARGMAEKRWNTKRSSPCNGDEADNYLKMGQSREDEAGTGSHRRWNATIQLTRAFFQLTTMMIGYLLMLAVMTFNAGYLLAILSGGFLGELALGWISY